MKFWPLFFKASALAVLIAALLLGITALGLASVTYRKVDTIARNAGMSLSTILSESRQGWKQQPVADSNRKNILILGSDQLETRPGSPALTDTMLVASLNLQSGVITAISLPRDLWSDEYKTKINALFMYGQERSPDHPEAFPTQVISELMGVPIHHTLVITMDTLARVVDAVGGIEVTVTESFTDTEFPRPDVDVTKEKDPARLYKTVSFTAGIEHMSGARVLEYVRSRHAAGDQGTDTARAARQQGVIQALITKMQNRNTIFDAQVATDLLTIYRTTIQPVIGIPEGIATLKKLLDANATPSFRTVSLPIHPDDPNGVITHPVVTRGTAYAGQWVYVVRDPQALRDFVHRSLLE